MEKIIKKVKSIAFLLMFAVMFAQTSYAAGAAPAGVDTTAMNSLIDIVLWVLRIIIGIGGCIVFLPKIVQGKADENPRDFNAGIAGMVVVGVVFAATFAIKTIFFPGG